MLSSFAYVLIVLSLLNGAFAATNPDEANTLKNLYYSLQSPSALSSWTNVDNNPDPCGASWQGITCSGSKVTEIHLSGLGLSGTLTYDLDKLTSLNSMDFSNNQISGNIPYGLPPNVKTVNLENNKFSGSLPYSIGQLTSLTHLDVHQNGISGSLQDMFSNLGNLQYMDLSSNSLSGQLPESFSSLTSLGTLYLQNNQFTGPINVLANLPLENVNIQNNKFTGWVPSSFSSINNAQYGGNSFSTSPAPPPPPYTPPPPGTSSKKKSSSKSSSGSGTSGGTIAGIVIAVILSVVVIGLIVAYFLWKPKKKYSQKYAHDDEKFQSTTPVLSMPAQEFDTQEIKEKHESKASLLPIETVLKPPPSEPPKESIIEKVVPKKMPFRRGKNQISATAYSVSELQVATNSFSEDHIIGEGVLGPVYRAEMPKGKVLAVKKIEASSTSENEEDFMDIVSTVSRIRHSNIAELVGYCVEHGQRLLAYDYYSRGSLADTLHLGDDATKSELTWNIRVKIALGAARALEYLHEVSQPAIIHKNFKSANILLDEEFNPHVSDSGTADLASDLESQAAADSAAYRAPEYTMSGMYTWQSDVYSFGVVMLELLTGRKPMDNTRPRAEQSLVRWATPQLHDIDALANMVDPALDGHYPVKSLSRFADIIALCVQPEMEFRPSMSEVVQSLVRLMQRATNKRRSGDDQRGQDSSDV